MNRVAALSLILLALGAPALAAPPVQQIGTDLYAYVSDDDSSANSTFLVGPEGILVVDSGLTPAQGQKLLSAIRSVSALPIRYLINTHYHPDHQGGNAVLGPEAVIISTEFTRQRTLEFTQQTGRALDPAQVTFDRELVVHVGSYPVRVIHPGPAHTLGDVYVYFPQQQVVAAGDLFLTQSSPAMDRGSVKSWIAALESILALPIQTIVPGHFEVASRKEFTRFKNYLSDLYQQVSRLRQQGASLEEVRSQIDASAYADFRQYPQYRATFADNAETIFQQLGED